MGLGTAKLRRKQPASVLAMCAALCLLSGCHRRGDDPTKLRRAYDLHKTNFNQIQQLHNPTERALAQSVGTSGQSDPSLGSGQGYLDGFGHRVPRQYYTIYCDIYWKLNWIRGELRKGHVPRDLEDKLDKVSREASDATIGMRRDGNYTACVEALKHLKKGLEHYRARCVLDAAGAQVGSAPWGSGSIAMQEYIDAGSMGFGEKRRIESAASDPTLSGAEPITAPAPELTLLQRRAVRIAMDYAEGPHISPQIAERDEWRKAIEQINKLRDQLWQMNKANNRDAGTYIDLQASGRFGQPGRRDGGASQHVHTERGRSAAGQRALRQPIRRGCAEHA